MARQVSISCERPFMRITRWPTTMPLSLPLNVARGMVLPLRLHAKARHSYDAAGVNRWNTRALLRDDAWSCCS